MARRMLAAGGPPGQGHHHRHRRRRRPTRTPCCCSCGSAARRRGSRRDAGRWSAAASGRRPPARAAWRRRCAPCRSCSTSPSGCASGPRPDAWIVDFTNPVGIVTRALLDAGHRAVGLCNVAIGFQRRFAGMLGVEPERVRLDHVGLNHLTWSAAVLVGRARRAARAARPATPRRSPTGGLPASAAAQARRRPVVLPALLLRPRRGRGRQRAADPRGRGGGDRARLLAMYADPAVDTSRRCSNSAAAPTTPRRPRR